MGDGLLACREQVHILLDDLLGAEVAKQPHGAGPAEGAALGASDLTGKTGCMPALLVDEQNAFNHLAVMETDTHLGGSALIGLGRVNGRGAGAAHQ